MSKARYSMSITRPNTSTKEARADKIGLYFTFFCIELYIFLISLAMVNIVLHVLLFQLFEYQGVYIGPSEMLLSNQGRMTSCAKIAIDLFPDSCFLTLAIS